MQLKASAKGVGYGAPTPWYILFPFFFLTGYGDRAHVAPIPEPRTADLWFLYYAVDEGMLSVQTSIQLLGTANARSESHIWATVNAKLKLEVEWGMYQNDSHVSASIPLPINIDAEDV
jgi:hypothetical protein